MKQTGQSLREAREKKGITISEVSMATKISSKILEAMESGDLDNLPSKAFLRGFVQTYANYLKLDIKSLMNSFNSEMGIQETKIKLPEEVSATSPSPEPTPSPSPTKSSMPRPIDDNSSNTGQKIAIGVGVLVIMLVIKLLFQTIEKYERESKAPSPSEIESTIKRSASDETPAPIAPPQKPVAAPEPPPAPAPKPAPPAPAKPPVIAEKKSAPAPATPPPSDSKRALLSETGASIQNKEVIVEALDNVEIVFSVDGGAPKRARLDTDKIQIIKASSSIKLDVSDGGAINVIFNGQDMGVPGSVGKPMQLSYP